MSIPTVVQLPRRARAYVTVVCVAGAATVLQSFYDLAVHPIGWHWAVLAVLTLVSGSATVRLPSLPATISVSETFVFTSVLLFGPSAGTLTVALDALVISFWSYRKGHPRYKIVFNVCALPLTIWIAAHIFFFLAGTKPLVHNPDPIQIRDLLGPLLVFTLVYFSLNSWIITFAISLEKGLPAFKIWRDNFVWLSLNYFGGASVAALLVSYTKQLDYTYLAIIVPLLVVLYFTFSMSMGRVEDANRHLAELNTLYMSTIETLAMAIDAKDQITHGHIRRVQTYAVALAKEMGVTDPQLIRAVEAAALLHDMGKLAVPEYILNKPGPLTPAEFEKMKLHAGVGADILSSINFPYPVVPIVRHHHENWDGKGYPDGLAATEIPIGARILSVVDCYDALTSDRPYRPRLSAKDALKILSDRRGTMYDPLVVDTFIKVHTQILPSTTEANDNASLMAITEASQPSGSSQTTVRPFDDIAASTEEMLTLFDLARGLSSPMTLQAVGDVISKHLRRLVPCSLCVFFIYEADSDEVVATYAAGDNASLISGLRIGLGQRLSGWVAANRQSIRNSDPVLDLGESARAITPRPRSCLSTPFLIESELLGVLTLYSTSASAFSEEHQRVVEVVARQVAPIIKQTTTMSRLGSARENATSARGLEEVPQLTISSLRGNALPPPTSLLLIDVDNLSAISKQLGRQAADDVLTIVLAATRRCLRPTDPLFRYNGSAFIALLIQTDSQSAAAIGTRIRSAAVEGQAHSNHRFAVSVVAVSTPGDGASIEELIGGASRALQNAQNLARRDSDHRSESIH